jgi:hypothetical protein
LTALGAVHVSDVEQVRAALARAGVDRRPTVGTVSLQDGAPLWRARRGRASMSLSGCELLRVAGASTRDRDAHHDDVVLTVGAPGGDLLRLHLAGADAPRVQDWIAAAPTRAKVPAPRPAMEPLAGGEAVWSRISTAITARAAAEGWGVTAAAVPPASAPDRRWWRVATLRRIAAASAVPSVLSVLLLLTGLATGTKAWFTTIALAHGPVAVADGHVVRTADNLLRVPFTGHDVRVEFAVDGRAQRAWVSDKTEPPAGAPVTVVYNRHRPGVARLDGGANGLARDVWPGSVLVALGALGIGRRVRRGLHHVRAVARLRTGPARTWRYVRFLDPSGAPALMLFSRLDDPAPRVLVPLSPLGALGDALPLHGEVEVHGEVTDGGLAVPVINGHTCWPIGTAEEVPAEVVRKLTNGTLPVLRRDADRGVRA